MWLSGPNPFMRETRGSHEYVKGQDAVPPSTGPVLFIWLNQIDQTNQRD